jgi:ABC-2 type transport system ATP-binding protein
VQVDKIEMIKVENLKKSFRTFKTEGGLWSSIMSILKREYVTVEALKGISFQIEEGEIRGFIGPNGAGKSTTIKLLSGILYPTEGSIKVNKYSPWNERERYVKHIGVVFGQKQQLWQDLPSIDTYNLNKVLYDIPDDKYKENLGYYVRLMGIQEIIKRPVRQLSLGEKMKCELIGALLHDPPVVFLDEPTIGLDLLSKEKIRGFIKKVNKDRKTTFLLTTHDLDDIENLCQKILVINNGIIVFDGKLSDIRTEVFKTKSIDVTFKEKTRIEQGSLGEGIRIVSSDDYQATLEVDLKKEDLQVAVKRILEMHNIKDLNVSSPPIETVIKRIYEK